MAIIVNGKRVAGLGKPGKSAYQAAVDGGYTGTEPDFNAILGSSATEEYVTSELKKAIGEPTKFDPNTVLLLHGDSFSDASMYGVSVINNGAQTSNVQSKFGNGSFFFNTTSSVDFSSGVVDFEAGDWTFDWWEYATNSTNGARFSSQSKSGTGMCLGRVGTTLSINKNYNTASWNLVDNSSAFDITVNEWVHWAVVRNGTNIYVFKNGTLRNQPISIGSVNLVINTTSNARVGANPGAKQGFIGYIEEFRISNIARWTSDFTPPNAPY